MVIPTGPTTRDGLISLMRERGWTIDAVSNRGETWRSPGGLAVAVPYDAGPNTFEWPGVVARVLEDESQGADREDVIRFSIESETELVRDSISLRAADTLIAAASKVYRAGATSSQTHRSTIDGNYSRVGDRIVASARMGHTERGSFVVPVIMPIPKPDADSIPGVGDYAESSERRVTRTVAQSLVAIGRMAERSADEVVAAPLTDLVAAGVTREAVQAVESIVSLEPVARFNAAFEWSEVAAPRLPSVVRFPASCAPTLREIASRLRRHRPAPGERLTGLITALADDPGELGGEMTVRTVRAGREVRVVVDLTEDDVARAHKWFSDREALLVEGVIMRSPGRPLRMPTPTQITPIAETILFS